MRHQIMMCLGAVLGLLSLRVIVGTQPPGGLPFGLYVFGLVLAVALLALGWAGFQNRDRH